MAIDTSTATARIDMSDPRLVQFNRSLTATGARRKRMSGPSRTCSYASVPWSKTIPRWSSWIATPLGAFLLAEFAKLPGWDPLLPGVSFCAQLLRDSH